MEQAKPQKLEKISDGTILLNPDGSVGVYLNLSAEQLAMGNGRIILDYEQMGNRFRYAVKRNAVDSSQIAPEIAKNIYSKPNSKIIMARNQLNRLFGED